MITIERNALTIFENNKKSIPSELIEVYKLAQDYNKKSEQKLRIFKENSNIKLIKINVEKKLIIQAVLKNIKLTSVEIEAFAIHGHCCTNNSLYFCDEGMKTTLQVLFIGNDKFEKIQLLAKLSDTIISESDKKCIINDLSGDNLINSDIKLTIPLYDYQIDGKKWLIDCYNLRSGALLADDMGLGKTAQLIGLITGAISKSNMRNCLIVMPNSLIDNWLIEFEKFSEGINPYVHWGSDRVGFAQFLKPYPVIITTYNTVVNDFSLFQDLMFDCLILDEASMVKNPEAQRAKAIKGLSYAHCVAITGTPFENSVMDLWSITNILKENFLGGLEKFKAKYVPKRGVELEQSQIEEIENKVKSIMLRRLKEDVLEQLPDKMDIHKPLRMGESEKNEYEKIEQEIMFSIKHKNNALELISHLRTFTSHPMLLDGSLASASLSALCNSSAKFNYLYNLILKTRNDEKVLIFANHIKLIEKLKNLFWSAEGIPTFKIDGTVPARERQQVIDAFSKVKGKALMFLNPKTAGMGLNITSANHVIHYSRQWNPALEAQATARVFRNGQKKGCYVYYLYYANSIEEQIHKRLNAKVETSGALIKASEATGDEIIYQTFCGD